VTLDFVEIMQSNMP